MKHPPAVSSAFFIQHIIPGVFHRRVAVLFLAPVAAGKLAEEFRATLRDV
jgi:hypothetical protein